MFCLQHPAPTPGSRGCTDFRQKGQNCKAHYEMATSWACHHRDRDESPHGISPKPCQLPLFFHEGMLSLPFTAKISRQHREEIPLFFGTCYVILKGEKTTRMGNSSSSFR